MKTGMVEWAVVSGTQLARVPSQLGDETVAKQEDCEAGKLFSRTTKASGRYRFLYSDGHHSRMAAASLGE
jgi:hypothetical protein